MTELPFVSIIIPTYNRGKLLPLTIDSFIAQSYPKQKLEIIVADNCSTDNTNSIILDYCRNHSFIKGIYESRQGVHFARNSASRVAIGEILYFTDDDMIADKCLIEEIVKVFDIDSSVGTVTGRIIGKFDNPPPPWVNKYMINAYLSLTDKNKPEDLMISKNDMVFSCHQAVKREVFFKAGGFNPENTAGIWIGDGETGLNIKIKNLGYKFGYTGNSLIYHIIPDTRTTLNYLIKRLGNQGNCDSYTDYRRHRKINKLILTMIKRNTSGFVKIIGITLVKIVMGMQSWHFVPAQLMYLHKRNVYDLKLFFRKDFRKLVEIDDWLNYEGDIIVKF